MLLQTGKLAAHSWAGRQQVPSARRHQAYKQLLGKSLIGQGLLIGGSGGCVHQVFDQPRRSLQLFNRRAAAIAVAEQKTAALGNMQSFTGPNLGTEDESHSRIDAQ